MNMKIAAMDLTLPRHKLSAVDMRSELQIHQPQRIVSASEFFNLSPPNQYSSQQARSRQVTRNVYTTGQVRQTRGTSNLDTSSNSRPGSNQPKCYLGSAAVGVKFGILPTEQLTLRDLNHREIITALRTGQIKFRAIYDIHGRLTMRKRGVVVTPPNRREWRCSWCFEEYEHQYNNWDKWIPHEVH
ncbi:hypothetical protein QAD02_015115 [Eretmocerus hayati]|uniref:Uncharacterized protein n=1 Tax=Eretmocerus hayati TaxID=131215 RepID=A0ACC2P7E8_9HYME|nr:hypothetical protein QAD02_015115 [Eretmocerus hayati]